MRINTVLIFSLCCLCVPAASGIVQAGAGKTLTVVAVGDIMMGSTGPRGVLPPDDGEMLFKEVAGYLNGGDIVFGNLEGPLLDGGEAVKCKEEKSRWCFEFKSPTRYGAYLNQAGFNALNLANNHSFDFGWEGIQMTLETLKTSGIKGLGGNLIASFEIKGRKVGLVGFSFNPSYYALSLLDIPRAREIVGRLKEAYDLVIVSFHGGGEGKDALRLAKGNEIFLGENRGDVVNFSRSVIDAGADLVLGHGPHVLRPLEIYRNKLIAYSLGNFLTYGMFNLKGPMGISTILKAELSLENGDFLEGQLVPLRLVKGGLPEVDPEGEGIQIIKSGTIGLKNTVELQIDPNGRVSKIR